MKYFQVLILILVISCKNSDNGKQLPNEEKIFFDEQLGFTSNESILKIHCKFMECGEWGGHNEYITIAKKNNELFKLNYEKYNVNCDSMVQVFDGKGYLIQPKSELVKSKEIEIHE